MTMPSTVCLCLWSVRDGAIRINVPDPDCRANHGARS